MNYLIDLERSIQSKVVHYWKANSMGYTPFLDDAGLYSDNAAWEIYREDIDGRTVIVPETMVKDILK